jgi:hypothetical protein
MLRSFHAILTHVWFWRVCGGYFRLRVLAMVSQKCMWVSAVAPFYQAVRQVQPYGCGYTMLFLRVLHASGGAACVFE